MFSFALGRPVKHNHDINATFSDVLEPGLYFLKLFLKSGYKKVYTYGQKIYPDILEIDILFSTLI